MSNFSFSQCFQKAGFPGVSKGVIVWEWVKPSADNKLNLAEIILHSLIGKKAL